MTPCTLSRSAAVIGLVVCFTAIATSAPEDKKAMGSERDVLNEPPPMRRGVTIDLHERGLDDAALSALIDSGTFSGPINSIDLSGNKLTHAGVERLASAGPFSVLTTLTLDGNRVGDAGAKMVANLKVFPALAHLSLDATGITSNAVRALCDASAPRLRSLHLGHNAIGDAGVVVLASSNRTFTLLGLRATGITRKSVDALISGEVFEAGAWLDIAENGLDQASVAALWKAVLLTSGEGEVVSE